MRNGWDHAEFRDYILTAAANVPGVTSQADIARLTGVTPSLLSKWFRGLEIPSDASLRKIKEGFAAAGVKVRVRDMARLAGRTLDDDDNDGNQPAPPQPALRAPRAREVDQMLDPNSPLDDNEREAIDVFIDRLLAPYRPKMRRRRSA